MTVFGGKRPASPLPYPCRQRTDKAQHMQPTHVAKETNRPQPTHTQTNKHTPDNGHTSPATASPHRSAPPRLEQLVRYAATWPHALREVACQRGEQQREPTVHLRLVEHTGSFRTKAPRVRKTDSSVSDGLDETHELQAHCLSVNNAFTKYLCDSVGPVRRAAY